MNYVDVPFLSYAKFSVNQVLPYIPFSAFPGHSIQQDVYDKHDEIQRDPIPRSTRSNSSNNAGRRG